jgi:hypothetical protein
LGCMSASAAVFAVAKDCDLAVNAKSIVSSPKVVEYWVIDFESSSVGCGFGPVAIPQGDGLWFVPEVIFVRGLRFL